MKKYISTTKEVTIELMKIINKYDNVEIDEEQLEKAIKYYCLNYPALIFDKVVIANNNDANNNDNACYNLKKSVKNILGKRRVIVIYSVLSKLGMDNLLCESCQI